MGTWMIAILLLLILAAIVRHLAKQLKAGNGLCGGDCKHCGHCSELQEMQAKETGCTGNCASCGGGCSHCKS